MGGVHLLFDVPDPLRIASLPVASIVETIADGGANNNSASAHIVSGRVRIAYNCLFETNLFGAKPLEPPSF